MIMAGRIHSKILPLSTTGGVGVGSGANYDDDNEEEGLDVTIMGALEVVPLLLCRLQEETQKKHQVHMQSL